MKRRAKVACLGVLLALASCGAGCGSTAIPPSVVKDARAAVAKGDAAAQAVGPRLLRLREILIAVCREPLPVLPREQCAEAQETFNTIGAGYDDMGKALDVADLMLTFAEQAQ